MHHESEEKYEPPDAYSFLLAAGQIDHAHEKSFTHIHRCGAALVRLSEMNGSYKYLPSRFRADMKYLLEADCDRQAAENLAMLGKIFLKVERLGPMELVFLREKCSMFAKFWPVDGRRLLIEQKVPE